MSTTTSRIEASRTVNEVISRFPKTLPIFNEYGIDSCCGGAKTLAEVAEKHGFDLERLMERLNTAL